MLKTADVETIEQTTIVIKKIGDNDFGNTIKERISGINGKKVYSWSKYGGANLGLVQENITQEWACQACGDIQTSDLPAYMFEFVENEFIRICSICQSKKLEEHIKDFQELLRCVRIPKGIEAY